ncbi:LOW QUALITY PROTEIN: mucin-16 [Bactrocera dorsalis]|uniref:LOW QUALITY PROTEIN: mucin-16 n=1 Tax=Bactrocera dorsalis TaxID=27457 RepID=A0ABM3JNN9_BACDO|nr:LOW QUALITY PROTEIN: mucin-16 [Bactrocera dorsalis]
MLPLPRGAVWQTLFLLCAVLFINEVRSEGRVVCYYTNWSVYRPGTAKFNPQNINPYLCTHLVYAFGGFTKDNQMKPFDKYQDVEQGGYAKFTGLKTYNKQLKTMIAIGGWNEASSRFSPLMANPERRQQFIKNILKFLRQNHFDGIDLDWEYPAQREGGKPRDRDNYAQFVQELRAEFERESQKTGRPRLLLTMAVPAGIENIEKGYDIPKLNKYLDWFNVLSYDFHSSHEPSANHHAPLYSLEEESEYNYDAELNIDYSIKYYLKAGADRDKLVLGIPTYGRSYTLINEESTEIGAPSEGPGEQGDATREKGYLAYYEICQNLKEDPEWTVVQPNPNAMGPYAYRRNQWVGYDDEAIVRKKAQYVVENGLGGIMFWAIDNDDFRGTCNGKPYPLIEAAKDAMLEGLGLGINEVAKPNSPKKPSRSRSRENSSSKLNRIGGSSEGKGSASRTTLSSGRRRIQSSTTTTTQAPETTIRLTNPEGSSLYIGGRVTTPAPPTTPDPGTDFKCEEEGFFQHPRDCKKYYWCLDSGPSGLGIVGHQFTCPSGLYFNPAADSCDFARNVPCKTKKATTAAPVTSTTTTTTTPRPSASPNRISAATSRTSFFRTTTTTTSAPEEYEEEEEEEVEDAPAHAKDRDAEEDPQVIKELIELIRKVGGLEELEKHLQHKDDGSISIKGSSSESGVATTPTPISKNLYDKVLSKPNTFNSFRNRFTSSSLFRKSGQTKTEESTSTKLESEESQSTEGASSSGYSKYSSVVRGNSRQGPQNEGLDKLSEFDGFLKEKKQYVTINRHRGAFRGQDDEDEVEEKQTAEELNENTEEEELSSRSKTTKRPTNTVTPSYASIKRTRPTTLRTESDEEAEGSDEEVKTVKESEEKRTYTSLNRNRGRFTTTESSQAAEEIVTNANRYKYLERTRPTNRLQTSASSQDDDEEDQEDEQNVTVQLNGAAIDSTQKSTHTTTRIYANIGRRTTTTTETPITTQETPTRYNLLENTFSNNETPEPILPTTTTTVTTANDSPALSITIKNTNPQFIPITTKQTITTTSQPIISTTNAAATTTTSNDIELTDTKSTITTLPPNLESDSKDALDLSLDVNSLIEKTTLTPNESPKDIELAETTTARTTKATTTTETLTSTATTATSTDTDQTPNGDEVTNLSNNRTKTQYKFITRTRNVTKATTTTTNTDIDTENESESENNKIFKETKKTSLKSGSSSSTDDKLSSNIRGNTFKYSGGRRQQQTNELLTRKNQIQNQQLDSTTDSTNSITTTESTPTNEFLGTISSPRPFGYPRRRTRPNNTNPTNNADIQITTTESSEDEQSIVKTRLTATSASKNKVSSNSDVLQVQNGLETNADEGSTTRTLTQTKLHTHTHVVDVVDGVSGINTNNSLRHVVDRNHSLSINDTLSAQEKSDSRAHTASAETLQSELESKREQLANTVLENKSRVSVTQLNALTTNTKDETVKASKYRGKSLTTETETSSAQNSLSARTADSTNFRSRGLKMVSEEKDDLKSNDTGKESVSNAENETNHTTSTYTTVTGDNGEENTTSTVTMQANETTITDEGNGMVKIQTVYTTITNSDEAGTKQHKISADEHSTLNSNENGVNNNKAGKTYATISRGHMQTHESKLDESHTATNEDLGTKNTTTFETLDDGSVVRTTVYTTRTKDSSGKIITTTVEETITTRTKIENYVPSSDGESSDRKYQTITRRTDHTHEPTTETIHYNTIVRGSDGVKLNEDQTSSFYRNLEEVAKQAEQSRSRIYQGISRGGKIAQTTLENEATSGVVESEDSRWVGKSETHTIERGSSKYHTINRGHTESGFDASTVTSNQRENSRFTDKTSKNANGYVSTNLSKEKVSGLQITEDKNESSTSTKNSSEKSSKFTGASVDSSLEVENTAAEITDEENRVTTPRLAETTTASYTTTTVDVSTSLPEIDDTTIITATEVNIPTSFKERTSSQIAEKNTTLYISKVHSRPTTTEIPVTTVIPEIKETSNSSSSLAELATHKESFTHHRGITSYSAVKSEDVSNETAKTTRVRPTITKTSADTDSTVEKNNTTHHRVATSENTEINSTEVRHIARSRPRTTPVPQTTKQSEIEETTVAKTETSRKYRNRPTTTAVPETTTRPEIEKTTVTSTETNRKYRNRPTTTAVPETTTQPEIEETTVTSTETSRKYGNRPTTTAVPETTTRPEIEKATVTSTETSRKYRNKPTTTVVPETTTQPEIEETTVTSTETSRKYRNKPTTTAVPETTTHPKIEETTVTSTETSRKYSNRPTTTTIPETTTHQEMEETTTVTTEQIVKARGKSTTIAVPETTTHQGMEETTIASSTTTATPETTSPMIIEETTESVSTEAVTNSTKTEPQDSTTVIESTSIPETTTSVSSVPETTFSSPFVNTRHKVFAYSEQKHTADTNFKVRSKATTTSPPETTQEIITSSETAATSKQSIARHRVSGSTKYTENDSTEAIHKVRGRPITTLAPETTVAKSSETDRRNITRHRTFDKIEENSTETKLKVRSRPTTTISPETTISSSETDTNGNRRNGIRHRTGTSFNKTEENLTESKFRVRSRPTTTTANSETEETTLSSLSGSNTATNKKTFTRQRVGTIAETIEESSVAIKSKVRGKPTTTASPETTLIPEETTTSPVTYSTISASTTPATPATTSIPEIMVTTVTASAESLTLGTIDTTSEISKAEGKLSTTDSPPTTLAPEVSETSTLPSTETVTDPTEDISNIKVITEASATTESSTFVISPETTTTAVPTSTLASIQTATPTTSETISETEQPTTENIGNRIAQKSFKGTNHSFSRASSVKTKVSTQEKEAATENVDTQVHGSKGRAQTTRGYVLRNGDQVSTSFIDTTSNRKTTSHTYSANEKSSTTRYSSRRDEGEDDEIKSTTVTPQRRTTYRGTYRPRMDKDDLSSLLALDVNKHRPYNESQYNLGKRIYLDGIYKGEESSGLSSERNSYQTVGAQLGNTNIDAHEGSTKIGADAAATQDISIRTKTVNNRNGTNSNHRRTTVIRRRISGSRNSTRNNNEIVAAKLAEGSAGIKTVEGVGEDGRISTTFSSTQKKTVTISHNDAENVNQSNSENKHAVVKSTNSESLGSTTVGALEGSSNEEESTSSKSKKLEEEVTILDNKNIASDAVKSDTTNAGNSATYSSKRIESTSAAGGEADADINTSNNTANSSQRTTFANKTKSIRISDSNAASSNGIVTTNSNESSATNYRQLSLFAKNRKFLETEANEASTNHNVDHEDNAAHVSETTTTKLSGLNKVGTQGTVSDEGAVETDESNAKEFSRNRSSSFRSGSGRGRYSGRAQYSNDGSRRNVNRLNAADRYSSKTEYNESGSTKTQTTYTQTYNNGDDTQKTVKRVHTKTVQKAEPEYEYVYEVITEKIPPSTPRPVTRNRGGVRFRDTDLSSLLSLDFAAKSKRRQEGEKTIVKTRRKLIKKPATVTESENVEEYEYEEQRTNSQATTRPTRPTPTEGSTIVRRTRPTRPLRTTTSTTQRTADAEEEDVAQLVTTTASPKPTAKKGFVFKRPISKLTSKTTTTEEPPAEEPLTTTTEAAIQTTRKGFAFKRPISIITTTEAPAKITTDTSSEATVATPRPALRRKLIKIQRPLSKTKVEEVVNEQEVVVKQAKVVTSSQESSAPTTTTNNTTAEESVTITTFTTEETPKPFSSTSTEEATKITTTTHAVETSDDSLNVLKKQFSNAITNLRTNADETVNSKGHTTVLTKTTTTTNTVDGGTETITKTEKEITEHNSVSDLNNELNEAGEDASLSLPIYHRRKYYQYYKDSPVIYIGKPQPPTSAETSSVDIKKQIHEVFNISNDGNTSLGSGELDNNSADVAVATADNNNTDHFLLKTRVKVDGHLGAKSIGTKFTTSGEEIIDDQNAKAELEQLFASMQTTANIAAKEYLTDTKDNNRVGKTFREQISTITQLSALKPDLDSALTNPTTETTIDKEIPTIKITLLPQDKQQRNEDARALRNYVTLNRLRTTTEASPAEETTIASKYIKPKRVYGTLNRNRTEQSTNNLINEEIKDQSAISKEDIGSTSGRRTFNQFSKPSTRLTAKRPFSDNLNDQTATNLSASGTDVANDSIEGTTRRSLITIKRPKFGTTTVKTLEETDESNYSDDVISTTTDSLIKTTRRPLNALPNSRFRTTTAKSTDVVVDNEESNSVEQTTSSISSTKSDSLDKTTRQRLNSVNSSKLRSATVKATEVEDVDEEAQSSIENTTIEPQEKTTRRPLNSINSSKFRTTTIKTIKSENEDEELDETNISLQEKSTLRPLNIINGSKFRTTTAKITVEDNDSEESQEVPYAAIESTTNELLEQTTQRPLRPLNSINSSNFRTTTVKIGVEDNDVEENDNVDETTKTIENTTNESLRKTTRRPLNSINSLRFRTTTFKTAEEVDDIEGSNSAKETDASIEVTTSAPLTKTTRRTLNIINASRFRTTTVKTIDADTESEESNVDDEKTASTRAPQPNTTRRPLNFINSSRFRTTTVKSKGSIEGESTDANTLESSIDTTTTNPLETTTRRSYNSINRLKLRTTTAGSVDEQDGDSAEKFVKEETVTTTRRPLNALNRFKTTTESAIKDQNSAEDYIQEVTLTKGTTRRPYTAVNRLTIKTATRDEESSSEQIAENEANTTTVATPNTTKSKTRIYAVLNRKTLVTKPAVVISDAVDTTSFESSTENEYKRNYTTLNAVSNKDTSSSVANSTNIGQEEKVEDEENLRIIEGTTKRTYLTLNRISTTTESSEEVTAKDNEAIASTEENSNTIFERNESKQSEENTTETVTVSNYNSTDSNVENINTTTIDNEDDNKATRRPVLIRKRIYVTTTTSAPSDETTTEKSIDTTTESIGRRTVNLRKRIQSTTTQAPTTEAAVEETNNTTSTTLKATRIPLLIRKRLNATSSTATEAPNLVDETSTSVETITRRPFAGFNRQRLSTTTQLPAESLTNVDDTESAKTESESSGTKKIAFGQTNRHRALLLPTTETSTATIEVIDTDSTTRRTFGINRAKTTTVTPAKNAENLTTKRTFNVFAQKTRPTTTKRPLLPSINRSLYQRTEEVQDVDDNEYSDDYEEPPRPSKPEYQRPQFFTSERTRLQAVTRRPYKPSSVADKEYYDEYEDSDDEYDENSDEKSELNRAAFGRLPTKPPTTELQNSLQNLRDRVKLSQTRDENNEGVVNSRLQLLAANRAKTTARPTSTDTDKKDEHIDDGDTSAEHDSNALNVKNSIVSFFASRNNTNRTSTVANTLSGTKINLSLKSNSTRITDDESSHVVKEAEREADKQFDNVDYNDVDNDDDVVVPSTNDKGNEVNSKRRFQKYQFNRARFTTTTTTTTLAPTTTTSATRAATNQFTPKQLYQSNRNRTATRTNQVNALVDDKGDDDDDDEEDEDYSESEVNEDSTITTTESTLTTSPAPTLRRIRVLKYRRPVGGNSNATLISSSVNDNSNSTISSVTNTTNTVSESLDTPVSSEQQVERTRLAPFNTTDPHTQETQSESPVNTEQVPTKRFRKVIRKLIRPLNRTTEATLSKETKVDNELTTETTLTGAPRINGTRYGFGRGNSFRAQTLNATGVRENDTITEDSKLNKARTNLFGKVNRTRFGSDVNSGSTEKQYETDEEDSETDTEIETETDTEAVTAPATTQKPRAAFIRPKSKDTTTVASGFTLATRRPFVFSRASSTTKAAAENGEDDEEDGNEDENEEDAEEEEDYDENEEGMSTPALEQEKEIENKQSNVTVVSESTENIGAEQTLSPRPIVATTRLKKLLPGVDTTTAIATNELEESTDTDSNTNETPIKNTLLITRRPFGLLARTKATQNETETEINTEEQDTADIVTTTLPRRPYSIESRLKVSQNESESHDEEQNNAEVTTAIPRRIFGLGAQTKLKLNETENGTQEEEHEEVTTKSTPLVRPTFRRKLVARRPYVPPKVSGITISTTVPTTPKPKRKFVRRKFGRFHPFNAVNRNTGEGFVRTDPRGQLLPETKRFRIQDGKRVPIPDSETLAEDEEYEEYEDENDEDEDEEETTTNDEQNKPQTPVPIVRPVTRPTGLFNKPPTTLLNSFREKAAETETDTEENVASENEEEEEDEEEDEDEENVDASGDDTQQASPKFNTPTYRPKDNRVPPGARPALPSTSTPTSGNVPFNGRARQPPSSAERTNGNRFGTSALGNTRVTNRPRVVNRPQGVVPPSLPLKPIATTFERTTPVVPTKPAPFIPTNTRSYERKYTATSTETPETVSDNSLIEDLNIEALNARNKKIFDINSKKHTTLKPKIAIPGAKQTPTDQQQDTQDPFKQNTETENDDEYTADVGGGEQGYITTTPRTSAASDTNTDYYINANEISSQDNGSVGERTIFTTPQTPTTTLLHVFTQTDDEQTNRPPTDSVNTIGRLVPERARPKHKVVEINRIVEITSKAEKLRRKSKSNQEFLKPIEESQLQVESLPHLEQLGEISVVKFVHLVDGSDISVDGHSTVTDYTPTEPTASAPVRNSLPEGVPYFVPQYTYSTESAQVRTTLEQRNGKALIPEVIRSAVESSTISLEGLFEGGRQGKELNSVNNVYYIFGTDETTTTSTVNINENANVNVNETQNIEITTPSTSTSSSFALPTATTLSTTETSTTTTTTASALPLIPHSDSVNNIPNEVSTNLESTTIVGNTVAEEENTTKMPLIANTSTIEATFSQYNANLAEVNSNLVETTTSTAVATEDTASTDTAVKSSTYVRPVVPLPLLRPESNESSPLVITIANLDKVILSKVDRTVSAENKAASTITDQTQLTEPKPADSNAEYSSRFASIIQAPTNLIHDTNAKAQLASANVSKTVASSVGNSSDSDSAAGSSVSTNATSSLSSGSIVKEVISFSTETHVVRKKKSRKNRARKSQKSGKPRPTTVAPADAPVVTVTPNVVSNDEGYQTSSTSASVTELPTTTSAPITTPRVRVIHFVRTPTATTIVTATAQTRRPVLSVRRRKINSPNASSGIAYQTAITSLQTSQTAAATTTTANADASTKSDELLIITTELPTTTFNKQQLQRNRNKLVTPAATAATATTTDDLNAPTTTQFTAAAITLNNANNNQKSYLNTKYRAKLVAAGLSTISTSLATETPNVDGAAAAATTTASNDIIQQANVNTNTKQPSTVLRRKFQARRLITTTTTSATDDSATEQPRTPNPLFKRRFSLTANPSATTILTPSTNTPADALTTTLFVDGFDAEDASDQVAKSSVHTNHFNQFVHNAEDNEAQIPPRTLTSGIKASPLKSKSHIAVTTTHAPLEPQQPYVESITRRMGTVAATTEFTASKRKSVASKRRPQKYTPPTPQTSTESLASRRGQSAKEAVNRRRPNKYAAGDSFERLNGNQAAPAKPTTHVSTAKSSHRQVVDYDYYDDENERVVGNTEGQQLKVILHGRGIIECLDQGNFPHPLSCRKFISCAKFETGGVVGWEYTCPKGLSYDPVGGMCNWAAGLGCKE